MRNSILTSAAAVALILFSAPAFAQMSQNMPGMSMGGMSNDSKPAPNTGSTTNKSSPPGGAKDSMSGMDMSKMAAGSSKRGCGMHMTRTSMSMGSGNHRCMMHRNSMSMDRSNAPTGSNLEHPHFQGSHPGGSGSR